MHHQSGARDQAGVIGLEFVREGSHHLVLLDSLEEQQVEAGAFDPIDIPRIALAERQLCRLEKFLNLAFGYVDVTLLPA